MTVLIDERHANVKGADALIWMVCKFRSKQLLSLRAMHQAKD